MSGTNGSGQVRDLPRHEIRRLVSEEALGRIDTLEDKVAALTKINNRQAEALEATANAITGTRQELADLQALVHAMKADLSGHVTWHMRSWHWKLRQRIGIWLLGVSYACDRWLKRRRGSNVVSITRERD